MEQVNRAHHKLYLEVPGLRQLRISIEGASKKNLVKNEFDTTVRLFKGYCNSRNREIQ